MQAENITLPSRVKNLTGQTFHYLTAIAYVGTDNGNNAKRGLRALRVLIT
jgi:hypothetical protein